MLIHTPISANGFASATKPTSRATSVTRAVIRFDSEAELVNAAKRIVAPSLSDVFGFSDEFDCNDGIADLVLYRLRPHWQLAEGLQSLSPRWAAALYALPYRRGFTIDWFAETNLVTRRRATQALIEYEHAGFCEPMATKNRWVKTRQLRPIVSRIYAIEAKLRNWQHALSQASRYRAFANESWVLLDEASVTPAITSLDRFAEMNVGLASLSTTGDLLRHYVPASREPTDTWRFWFANVLIARQVRQENGGSTS